MNPEYDKELASSALALEWRVLICDGDGQQMALVEGRRTLPAALAEMYLEDAPKAAVTWLQIDVLGPVKAAMCREVQKRLPPQIKERLDRTHPDWVLEPDPEEMRKLRVLCEHAVREAQIAEHD